LKFKLELLLLPVADVDRAKAFYVEKVGFDLDVDTEPTPGFRIVQMTPPGSACSITVGNALGLSEPGTVKGTHLVVTDIEAACAELAGRGVEVSEITHYENGERVPGVDPNHGKYMSYADFADPDGNTWVLQEAGYGTD
jgi:catechol 2,3-dioxygenase-like lactoylglutathione lyase family enzyme